MNIKPVPAQMIIQMEYEEGFHDGYRQAMRDMPEIVRCKHCRHRGTMHCYCNSWQTVKDDWFCADGEMRI